jgi:hypothetical protein
MHGEADCTRVPYNSEILDLSMHTCPASLDLGASSLGFIFCQGFGLQVIH